MLAQIALAALAVAAQPAAQACARLVFSGDATREFKDHEPFRFLGLTG